jgi:hypothetical protein
VGKKKRARKQQRLDSRVKASEELGKKIKAN